jgi:hypothetical protein
LIDSTRYQDKVLTPDDPLHDDPWDDFEGLIHKNDRIGDKLQTPKPNHTTRLFFNNKNGFHLYDRMGGELFEDCETLKANEVDYAAFQEPNLDTTKGWVKSKIHSAARAVFDHFKLEFGSSPQQHLNEYKPGGTLTIVAGRLVGQVLESSHDYLGRWTRTVFSRKDGKRIAVYNSYQVGKANPFTQGKKTIINQLYSIFIQEGRSNTNPQYNHYADLSSAVKADVDLGFAIILGGDFNVDISIGTHGMSTRVQDCQLVGPIYYNHGLSNFNTHSRGSKCIDYIVVSEDLLDSITSCGYQPFSELVYSDH